LQRNKALDLLGAVDVRHGAPVAAGQESHWRDLGAWILGASPCRETPDDGESVGVRDRAGIRVLLGPAEGEFGRNDGCSLLLEEPHELRKDPSRQSQVEAEGTTKVEVLVNRFIEAVHRASPALGQGCARARKASKSTLA
jgi:hypothetical protein